MGHIVDRDRVIEAYCEFRRAVQMNGQTTYERADELLEYYGGWIKEPIGSA
jgi:hypothetical protein